MIQVRAATRADIDRWFPGTGAISFRAWACDLDGEPAGVVGVALGNPQSWLFAAFDEDLRPMLRKPAIVKAILRVRELVRRSKTQVLAYRDPGEERAPDILRKFGFVEIGYEHGREVYQCLRQ